MLSVLPTDRLQAEKENAQEPRFPRVFNMVGEEGLEPSKPYGG
jgi:hypothetical protein